MQKSIILDHQTVSEWCDAFQLRHRWHRESPSILAAALALNTLSAVTPQGYYLAKQKLVGKSLPPLDQELNLHGEITGSKGKLITCRSTVTLGNETLIVLDSSLLKTDSSPHNNIEKTSPLTGAEPEYRRIFKQNEIDAFARLSGDPNIIHRGVLPVVQGMLILLVLEDYLASTGRLWQNIDVRYTVPVRVNEKLEIHRNGRALYGVVNDTVCFKLNFEEQSHVKET